MGAKVDKDWRAKHLKVTGGNLFEGTIALFELYPRKTITARKPITSSRFESDTYKTQV
jgi:hypothetical protein